MCRVLNKHRDGIPASAVYVGRGSKWGNPFRIGVEGDRATVIARHAAWLRERHDLLRSLDELRSKDLDDRFHETNHGTGDLLADSSFVIG